MEKKDFDDIRFFEGSPEKQDRLEDIVADTLVGSPKNVSLYQKEGSGILAMPASGAGNGMVEPGDMAFVGYKDGKLDMKILGLMTEDALKSGIEQYGLKKAETWKLKSRLEKDTGKDYGIVVTADNKVKIEKIDFRSPFAVSESIEAGLFNIIRKRSGFLKPLGMDDVVTVVDDMGLYSGKGINKVGSNIYGNIIKGDVLLCRETWGPDGADLSGMSRREAEEKADRLIMMVNTHYRDSDFRLLYDPASLEKRKFLAWDEKPGKKDVFGEDLKMVHRSDHPKAKASKTVGGRMD